MAYQSIIFAKRFHFYNQASMKLGFFWSNTFFLSSATKPTIINRL
jgi:hypothetical protein